MSRGDILRFCVTVCYDSCSDEMCAKRISHGTLPHPQCVQHPNRKVRRSPLTTSYLFSYLGFELPRKPVSTPRHAGTPKCL